MSYNTITGGKRSYIKHADLPPTSSTHFGIEGCELEISSISMKAQRLCDSDDQTCEGPIIGQTMSCISKLRLELTKQIWNRQIAAQQLERGQKLER
jgi:hypothetical protein